MKRPKKTKVDLHVFTEGFVHLAGFSDWLRDDAASKLAKHGMIPTDLTIGSDETNPSMAYYYSLLWLGVSEERADELADDLGDQGNVYGVLVDVEAVEVLLEQHSLYISPSDHEGGSYEVRGHMDGGYVWWD
jgi:hypothetical protein